jgi:hypothetical protein
MERISKANRDTLLALRILPSRGFTDSNMRSKMMMGATLDPFGLVLLNFDNIGFKILGQYASYSSFTLFQEIHIK